MINKATCVCIINFLFCAKAQLLEAGAGMQEELVSLLDNESTSLFWELTWHLVLDVKLI